MVHRLVDRGVGIEVGPELDAVGLAPVHDARRGGRALEVLRPVKGHVFQEVGQSALAWLLENGAHALGNVEVGHAGFLGVVAYVIGESVLQSAGAESRVLRYGLGHQRGG